MDEDLKPPLVPNRQESRLHALVFTVATVASIAGLVWFIRVQPLIGALLLVGFWLMSMLWTVFEAPAGDRAIVQRTESDAAEAASRSTREAA